MNTIDTLVEIAKNAYGSAKSEGISGGRGNMGILDGRIVKFDTHFWAFGTGNKEEQRTSCDELRKILHEAAKELLNNAGVEGESFQNAIAEINKKLGINDDGIVVSKSLLERSVVASVISQIEEKSHRKIWDKVNREDVLQKYSTKAIKSDFNTVKTVVELNDQTSNMDIGRLMDGIEFSTDITKNSINTLLEEYADEKKCSKAHYELIKNFVIKIIYAEIQQGHITSLDDLQGDESIIQKFKDFLQHLASEASLLLYHFQSLSGASAAAYIKALHLFITENNNNIHKKLGDQDLKIIAFRIFNAVDKLAVLNLYPEKITISNVVKIIDYEGRCTSNESNLRVMFDKLFGKDIFSDNLTDQESILKMKFAGLYHMSGGTFYDAEKILNNSKLFDVSKITAGLYSGISSLNFSQEDFVNQFPVDAFRNRITLKFPDGSKILPMPTGKDTSELIPKIKEDLATKINNLCDEATSELMKKNLTALPTQNGPFSILVTLLANHPNIGIDEKNQTYDFIKNDDGSITVHCMAGNSFDSPTSAEFSIRFNTDGSQNIEKSFTYKFNDELIKDYILPEMSNDKKCTPGHFKAIKNCVKKLFDVELQAGKVNTLEEFAKGPISVMLKTLLTKDAGKAIQVINHLQSLSGEAGIAYLKAANLFLDLGEIERYKIKSRILEVSDELTKLNKEPEKFTFENVAKILLPDGNVSVKNSKDIYMALAGGIGNIVGKDADYKLLDEEIYNNFNLYTFAFSFADLGGTFKDAVTLYNDPSKFHLSMLPPDALFGGKSSFSYTIEDGVKQFLIDSDRDEISVHFDRDNIGEKIEGLRPINFYNLFQDQRKTEIDKTRKKFETLCGDNGDNELMIKNILLSLTQNAPFKILTRNLVERCNLDLILKPETYILQKNEDGSVTINWSTPKTKKENDSDVPTSAYAECSIRINADGSQKLERFNIIENKENGSSDNA